MAYKIDSLHLVTIFFPFIDNLKVYKCQRFLAVRHIHIVTPNPPNAEAIFIQQHKNAKIFENPVMLVYIGKLLRSGLRCIPMCQGFGNFSGFLHHFVLAKLATSSISVKVPECCTIIILAPFVLVVPCCQPELFRTALQ